MNWKEYKQESQRTFASEYVESCISDPVFNDKINQIHCVIGVSTEIAELMAAIVKKDDTNVKEEIGDIFWYISNLERLLGESGLTYLPSKEDSKMVIFVDELLVGTQELLDHYKKAVYYGSDVDKDYVMDHCFSIKRMMCSLLNQADVSPYDVLDQNIRKLKTRYPDKFTQEAAEKRDLDAERKELER